MKKIIICSVLSLMTINMNAFGVCSLEKIIEKQEFCSGAAAPVNESEKQEKTNYEELKNIYTIPTISLPNSYQNGFPIINPNQGCPFGICLQK